MQSSQPAPVKKSGITLLQLVLIILIGGAVLVVMQSGILPGSKATPTATPSLAKNAYYTAQQYVQDHLKAPATAKFSNVLIDDKTGYRALTAGKFDTWGWVDSENSFGALLRSDWRVILQVTGGDKYKVLYAKIGDMESGPFTADIAGPTPTP